MVVVEREGVRRDGVAGEALAARPAGSRRWWPDSFFGLALASYLAATIAVTGAMISRTGGRLIYVIDDPIIHLSVADNLLGHGTWGVEPGQFQSASSSPLWTLLLVPLLLVVPIADEWLPLLLNVVSGVALLAVLSWHQRVLRPGRKRPLDAVCVVVLVVAAGFLPGLAVTGMEHTLHAALVVAAVCLVSRDVLGPPGRWARWVPFAVLAVASLVRFETLFVAGGLAVGVVAASIGAPDAPARPSRAAWTAAVRRGVLLVASATIPVAVFAVGNRALGGGWLPNSVLAKGRGAGTESALALSEILQRLLADPLLLALLLVSVGVVVLGWRRSRAFVLASTMVVATVLHVALADLGWFERYQAYLVVLGVAVVLEVVAELPSPSARQAKALLALAALLLAVPKVALYPRAPRHAAEVEGHHLASARFLRDYYDGQPIGIDQLGYISYLHDGDGPITDFFGLGDDEALELRKNGVNPAGLDRLARTRGFRVAVTYELNVPPNWIAVADLVLRNPATLELPALHVYATVPDEVVPLRTHLLDFRSSLPPGVDLRLNELAVLRAESGR